MDTNTLKSSLTTQSKINKPKSLSKLDLLQKSLDEDQSENSSLHFQGLEDLSTLNNEIQNNLVHLKGGTHFLYIFLFDRPRIERLGLTIANVEIVISDCDFQNKNIQDPKNFLLHLENFNTLMSSIYHKNMKRSVLTTGLYAAGTVLLFFLYGLSFFPILMAIFTLSFTKSIYDRHTEINKLKRWYLSALSYTKDHQEGTTTHGITGKSKETTMEDVLRYEHYFLEKEKDDWSVKIFDFINTLIAKNRKKEK